MVHAGQRLKALREQLGLTLRDVESASLRIAEKHGNPEFAFPLSRLSDAETKGVVPTLYRLYSLAVVYRRDLRDLLAWYGVDLRQFPADLALVECPRTHLAEGLETLPEVQLPVRMDPGFDLKHTTNLGRMIERWGVAPLAFLADLANAHYTYGYIGSQDFTMYPLLLPGSFVQVDERRNEVATGGWASEYERPVYFVETREGFTCCWCDVRGSQLILQPHPLSPVAARVLRPNEADVLGQVVGVAMRLGDWRVLRKPAPEPLALQ